MLQEHVEALQKSSEQLVADEEQKLNNEGLKESS